MKKNEKVIKKHEEDMRPVRQRDTSMGGGEKLRQAYSRNI